MKPFLTTAYKLTLLAIAALITVYPMALIAAIAAKVNDCLHAPVQRGMLLGANTLTQLIPDAFQAMDTVVREMVGFIPACTMNADAARAALGQTVRSHVAPALAAVDTTPAAYPADAADFAMGNKPLTITKSKVVPFHWLGEEQKGAGFSTGYTSMRQDQIAQAIRTLVNLIEVDLGTLALKGSRAYGTANTTPFASDLSDTANVLKILKDNGAPGGDLQCVINTTAGAKVRTLTNLTKANEAGTIALREQGILLPLHGMTLRESAAVQSVAVGTAAAGTTNAAGYAVGATVLTLAAVGTGTIISGDVMVFAGDVNKYVIDTTSGGASLTLGAGGTITLQKPGLRVAMSAATKAITTVAQSSKNLAFHRSAMHLALRTPALPEEGDSADDRMVLTDERTGISFEFAMYKQYRRVRYEVAAAWGYELIKNEFSAVLLGEA